MNIISIKCFVLLKVAFLITINCFRCSPINYSRYLKGDRFEDVIDAVDSLNEVLAARDVPPNIRCDRYAILLLRAEITIGPFLAATIERLRDPDGGFLHENLYQIDHHKYIALFMTTIDKYRTSRLGPGFIDLIDCLRQIERPETKQYLLDDELIIIEELYRQVLASPQVKFDLNTWKWPNLRFMMTLMILFKNHIPEDQIRQFQQKFQLELPTTQELSSDSQRKEYEPKQEGQFKLRERDRLRKRRCRVLNPESIRERDRISKRRLREKMSSVEQRPLRGAYERKRREPYRKTRRQKLLELHMQDQYARRESPKDQSLTDTIPDLNKLPPDVEIASGNLDRASSHEHPSIQASNPPVASFPIGEVFLPATTHPITFESRSVASTEPSSSELQRWPTRTMQRLQLPYFTRLLDSPGTFTSVATSSKDV